MRLDEYFDLLLRYKIFFDKKVEIACLLYRKNNLQQSNASVNLFNKPTEFNTLTANYRNSSTWLGFFSYKSQSQAYFLIYFHFTLSCFLQFYIPIVLALFLSLRGIYMSE